MMPGVWSPPTTEVSPITKAAEEAATPSHQIHGITNKVDQPDVLGDVKILKTSADLVAESQKIALT